MLNSHYRQTAIRRNVLTRVEDDRRAIIATRIDQAAKEPPTFSVPTTSVGKPVPFIIGTQLVTDANLIAMVNLQPATIDGNAAIVGDLQYGIALGPEGQLLRILEDDVEVWSGLAGPEKATLVGDQTNGHFRSNCYFYGGNFDQPAPTELAAYLPNRNPAYRGTMTIVMQAVEITSRLPKIAFEVSRVPNPLGLSAEQNILDGDVNVITCIAEILSSDWGGAGVSSAKLDLDSFRECAITCASEKNFASVSISDDDPITVIEQLKQQADCVVYHDPATGMLSARLIRYPVTYTGTPVAAFDVSNVRACRGWNKSAGRDVRGIQRIIFTDRENNYDKASITSQNLSELRRANANRIPVVTSFPTIFNLDLVSSIVVRELRKNSVPGFRFDIEANRDAAHIVPGQIVTVTWERYKLDNEPVVVRARAELPHDENIIVLTVERYLYPDFSGLVLSTVVDRFGNTSQDPQNPIVAKLIPVSADMFGDTFTGQYGTTDVYDGVTAPRPPYPDRDIVRLVCENANDFQTAFNAYFDAPIDDNTISIADFNYCPSAKLLTAIPAFSADGSTLTFDVGETKLFGTVPSPAPVRTGYILIDDEWFLYTDIVDNTDGTYTFTGVVRAAANTDCAAHEIGAIIYVCFNSNEVVELIRDDFTYLANPYEGASGNATLVGKNNLSEVVKTSKGLIRSYVKGDAVTGQFEKIGGPIAYTVDGARTGISVARGAEITLALRASYNTGTLQGGYADSPLVGCVNYDESGFSELMLNLRSKTAGARRNGDGYSTAVSSIALKIIFETAAGVKTTLFEFKDGYVIKNYDGNFHSGLWTPKAASSSNPPLFKFNTSDLSTVSGPGAGYTTETSGGTVKRIFRDSDGVCIYMASDLDATSPAVTAMRYVTNDMTEFDFKIPADAVAGAGFLYAEITQGGSRTTTPREKLPITIT